MGNVSSKCKRREEEIYWVLIYCVSVFKARGLHPLYSLMHAKDPRFLVLLLCIATADTPFVISRRTIFISSKPPYAKSDFEREEKRLEINTKSQNIIH